MNTTSTIEEHRQLWADIHSSGPRNLGFGYSDLIGEYHRRSAFIRKYGFAVPDEQAITQMVVFSGERKILEIGAGSGIWARLLSDFGATVTAVDSVCDCWDKTLAHGKFFPITKMDGLDAIECCPDHDCLFMCWPPYDSPQSNEWLAKFQGSRFMYIGESEYGCTGSKEFFALLEAEWNRVSTYGIPQWDGIHDYLALYERRS